MEDGKHAFPTDLLLKFILNLALFSFKNVFFMLLSLFSYLFHENETFATLRGVDFQLFRDRLVWFVQVCSGMSMSYSSDFNSSY